MSGGGGGDNEVKDTEDQKVLARIAAEQYSRNRRIYDGAVDEYMNYADTFDSPEKRLQASTMTGAATASAYGDSWRSIERQLTSGGVNPNSGAFISTMIDGASDEATARADNTNRSMQSLDDTGLQAQANIVAIGNKRSGSALSGMSEIAGMSAAEATNSARSSAYDDLADEHMVGMVAGAGYSAYRNTR